MLHSTLHQHHQNTKLYILRQNVSLDGDMYDTSLRGQMDPNPTSKNPPTV